MTTTSPSERRRFPRLHADVCVRPLRLRDRLRAWKVKDVSLGGARSYSDEEHRPGERLELEVLREGEEPIVLGAEVVWVEPLPAGAPARFDVGFRFVGATAEELERLGRLFGGAAGE